jgi:DNA primase
MPNSYVVKKEQCPMCKKLGKDNSEDNLAVYSDGHKFCYSCKYTEFPNKITSFKNKITEDNEIDYQLPYLPLDCDILYPQRALDWVGQYQLDKTDLYKHNVMWSESMQRLIFPVFGGDTGLIAWQGRYFGDDPNKIKKQKWYGKGNLKDTYNILNQSNRIVLCEDVISSIKLANCGVGAMPLYGSFVGRERFKRLYNLINKDDEVLVWLDYDKAKESLKETKLGQLCGINCSSIITKLDPKEIDYEEIKGILND